MIISRIMATISIIGMVGLIGYEYVQAIELQQKFQSFVAKGPRFTAVDGQELCERIALLESQSIEFRNSGIIQKPCLYYQK